MEPYETPVCEVVLLEDVDVIATSTGGDDVGPWP